MRIVCALVLVMLTAGCAAPEPLTEAVARNAMVRLETDAGPDGLLSATVGTMSLDGTFEVMGQQVPMKLSVATDQRYFLGDATELRQVIRAEAGPNADQPARAAAGAPPTPEQPPFEVTVSCRQDLIAIAVAGEVRHVENPRGTCRALRPGEALPDLSNLSLAGEELTEMAAMLESFRLPSHEVLGVEGDVAQVLRQAKLGVGAFAFDLAFTEHVRIKDGRAAGSTYEGTATLRGGFLDQQVNGTFAITGTLEHAYEQRTDAPPLLAETQVLADALVT